MEVDIRIDSKGKPTKIRYGEDMGDTVDLISPRNITVAEEYAGGVCLEDIDNIIKALQKAKELWG